MTGVEELKSIIIKSHVSFLSFPRFLYWLMEKVRFLKIAPERSTPFFRRAPPRCSQELQSEKHWSKWLSCHFHSIYLLSIAEE